MKSPRLFYKALRPQNHVVGHVDRQADGRVFGWVVDKRVSKQPIEVIAVLDGQILGSAIADQWRKDIFDAGLGSGFNGFDLSLNVLSELEADSDIVIMESSTKTILPGVKICPKHNYFGKYLFDITDLFFYLAHHDNPSGIQRVQIALIIHFVKSCSSLKEVTFIYFDEGQADFKVFDAAAIVQFMHEVERPKHDRTFSTGSRDQHVLGKELGAQGQSVQFSARSNLILLGAAWIFPEYFVAVAKAKRSGATFIALIHDLIPIKAPSYCDTGTASVFKFFMRRVVQAADVLLTVSEFTAHDLEEYIDRIGLPKPYICTIQNGDTVFSAEADSVLVAGDFVLYVSTIEGRKNHILAVEAWERLITIYGAKVPKLVFVGRIGWRVESLIERVYETEFLNGRLIILEEISDSELATLYKNCMFTIYPSFYEGWGLPVGESLSWGKVCIAANATAIPEVGRGQALLFDLADPNAFYRCAERLIVDKVFLKSQEEKLRLEFRRITWELVASRLLDVVERKELSGRVERATSPIGSEISFRRLSYLEANVSHGAEVARHAREFARPDIVAERLGIQNYVASDSLLRGSAWFPREDWGRWSNLHKGAELEFWFAAEAVLVIYLKIAIARKCPVVIEVSLNGALHKRIPFDKPKGLISFEVDRNVSRAPLILGLKLAEYGELLNLEETRNVGLGIAALFVSYSDNIEQRLSILERQVS